MHTTAHAATPLKIDTIIIGGGQAGLSTGYHLSRLGAPFVILERHARIGDTWRKRWDSLRLFSPARFDGLDGMSFPAPGNSFPTKDEMGDFLEAYAARFELPVRTGVTVDRVWREHGTFMVRAGETLFEARNVVVAMASYQSPRIPEFATALDPDTVQLHSLSYRALTQLRDGGALIVGAGNSGSEIALEVARFGHPTFVSGRMTGEIPFRASSTLGRHVLLPLLFRIVFHRVLTVDTPIGRIARGKIIHKGTPLIRTRESDLRAVGVARVPRTVGVKDGRPLLEDGRALDVANVVWCTGFDPGLSWIDLPIFDERGEPRHERGTVTDEPGLFFVGQHFLYAMSSTMIHGVGRDAERIANAIVGRGNAAGARLRSA